MVWGFEGEGKTTVPLHSAELYSNLKEYYISHPELAAKYNDNVHRYVHQIRAKFYGRHGSLDPQLRVMIDAPEDHEWPIEFRTTLPKEKAGRLKSLLDMGGGGQYWLSIRP